MPNTHVRVTVRSCRLCASVSPCKSQQSIVGQSALVICRRMQRITLFTFCLQYIGFEFLDFAGKFDILSFLLKFSQNMIYLDCDNDTDHDPLGPASTASSNDGQKLDSCTGGGFLIEHSYSNLKMDGKKWLAAAHT